MANIKEHDSKLINQGSYGCIYYPSLPFKLQHKHSPHTTTDERKRYVSKLQKHNFHSEFEDYIGKKIQDIPSFDIFFVPVLSTYKIDLATIKQSYVTECDAISKYIRRNTHRELNSKNSNLSSNDYQTLNKKFIMQKMKYINGTNLHDHLLEVVTKRVNTRRSRHDSDDSDDSDDRDYGSDSDSDGDDMTRVTKTLRKTNDK